MLFKSGLGLVINVYCKVKRNPKKKKSYNWHDMKGKNTIIKNAQLNNNRKKNSRQQELEQRTSSTTRIQ